MNFWTRISCLSTITAFLASCAMAQAPAASPTPQSCISIETASTQCDILSTITEIVAPDSPAFTLLGINPSNVSKPTSPAQLATSLINAFDDNGHFQSGAALDVVPYLVFAGRSAALGKLVPPPSQGWTGTQALNGYIHRVLTRSSVSFATTKGTSNPDTAVRLGTGLRIVLFDRQDPRAGFQTCAGMIDVPLDPSNPDDPARLARIKQAISDCRDKQKKVWNATSFTVAGATSWISTNGSTSNLGLNGGGYWASFAYGFGTWGQLIVNGRRITGQQVVPANSGASTTAASGTFVVQDSSVGGGAFRFGRSDFNGIVEGLYIGKRTAGVVDSYPEFGFGVEKKLADNFYLEVNYRYDVNSQVKTSGILANLKWSFNQQPKLAPK